MEVRGYENYLVLRDGTVIGARGKQLKVDANSTGYERVTLSRGGIVNRRFVHQLVAEAYHGDRPKGAVVNHIDGDIKNNHCDNLEWVTQSFNVVDGYKRGRIHPNKYSEWLIIQLKLMYTNGYSIKEISRRWGKDRGTVAKYVK